MQSRAHFTLISLLAIQKAGWRLSEQTLLIRKWKWELQNFHFIFRKQNWLIMKLTAVLLLSACLQVSANGFSQDITLSEKNVSLQKVFKQIHKQTGYQFFYQDEMLNKVGRIDINVKDVPLEKVLAICFKDLPLSYSIANNTITVKRKTEVDVVQNPPPAFIDIRGTIKNAQGDPLAGVSVIVRGTNRGTSTNSDGSFSIDANVGDILEFTIVGYQKKSLTVGSDAAINIQLEIEVSVGSEVVVIGYGTQRKQDVTGAVSSIPAEKFLERPVSTFDQALQGLVPGLQVAQRNASPGELSTINIRGIGSLSAGFEPLFVVDGFPTDQRNATAMNPMDIQSVEILKDASSTAIYGSRGANGVIIITTKSGSKGKAIVDVNISGGIAKVDKHDLYDAVNGAEYVQYYKEYYTNLGKPIPNAIANWDGTNTNWQNLIYQTSAFQSYSVSVHGGDQKVSYLFSGNYISQPGTIIGEGFDKYSARIKIDYRATKFLTLGLNIAPNFESSRRSSPRESDWGSLQSMATLLPPVVPVRKADGSYATMQDILPGIIGNVGNPLQVAENWKETHQNFLSILNAYAELKIIKGLTFKTSVGAGVTYNNNKTFWKAPSGPAIYSLPTSTTLNLSKDQTINWLSENTLNYKKIVNSIHAFDILAGYTAQKNTYTSVAGSTNTFDINGPETLAFGSSVNRTANNGATGNSLLSYLSRINYTLKDKYILTGSIRRDGSSRFGANNKYHTFGSGAIGWRFSEESFMEGIKFINQGKVRISYGTTGSNLINDFTSRASLRSINQSFNGTQVIGVINQDPGNASLSWETSKQLDMGLDLDLLTNRVNIVFDYYRNNTTDLLLQENVVLSSGFPGVLTNIGHVRNTGFEFALNTRIIDSKDLTWTVGGNVSHNEQKILALGKNQTELFNFYGALRSAIGGPIQQIKGTKAIGVVRSGNIPAAQPNAKPGDIIFEDVNKDGAISNFLGPDGVFLGDPNLDWVYGINTSLRYKNFRFSALLNGQAGGSVFDFFMIQVASGANGANFSKEFWYDGRYVSETEPGNGHTPGAGGMINSAAGAGSVSSLGVQKTDFIRIRNVSLTYELPSELSKKISLANARAYISVENLYTFTKFIGGNPYAARPSAGGPGLIGGSRVTGDGRELALNSSGSAPLPRIFTIGINFSF